MEVAEAGKKWMPYIANIVNQKTGEKQMKIGKFIIVVLMFCSLMLGGCTLSDTRNTIDQNTGLANQENETDDKSSEKVNTQDSGIEETDAIVEQPVVEPPVIEGVDRFDMYLNLLMMTLEEADQALGEESEKTEDESFYYKNQGITLWLDRGFVSQVLIMNSEVSFNGAYVGDDIQKFKDVFNEPSQDINSEAHFNYDNKFLIVQYDTKTGKTVAVYLLSEDYGAEESYLQ